jgi:hypothetical protein
MHILEIERPVIKKRTSIGQAYDELLKDMLPIHAWCEKNKK